MTPGKPGEARRGPGPNLRRLRSPSTGLRGVSALLRETHGFEGIREVRIYGPASNPAVPQFEHVADPDLGFEGRGSSRSSDVDIGDDEVRLVEISCDCELDYAESIREIASRLNQAVMPSVCPGPDKAGALAKLDLGIKEGAESVEILDPASSVASPSRLTRRAASRSPRSPETSATPTGPRLRGPWPAGRWRPSELSARRGR